MDEVDLILHPLKSELNFPIGPKEPLDLTRSSKGSKGLRWEIPFHMLDALFYALEGNMSVPLQVLKTVIDYYGLLRTICSRG